MPPRRQQAQVAVAAILAPASHPPVPRRLVQVAFAGPLAPHLPERQRPASQYHQALDPLQHCEWARELCVLNPTGVEVAAELRELPA
jgi:hypothetical protein